MDFKFPQSLGMNHLCRQPLFFWWINTEFSYWKPEMLQ